jgi:hypothetical protein
MRGLTTNQIVNCHFFKYIKLAVVAIIQVTGSMEDEDNFSTLSFIKSKLKNRLTTPLDLMIHMFCWNFPYHATIREWKEKFVGMVRMHNVKLLFCKSVQNLKHS